MAILELSDLKYKKISGRWPYVLTEDLVDKINTVWSHKVKDAKFVFCIKHPEGHAVLLGTLFQNKFTISENYASDGATHAITFKQILRRIFFHDIMCQFCNVPNAPFTRKDADEHFYNGMKEDGFWLTNLYFQGVRFGANFLQPSKKKNLFIQVI